MTNKLTKTLRGYLLRFLTLFSKKKRTEAVIPMSTVYSLPKPPIHAAHEYGSPANRVVKDITMMLDQEATELYGRSPFVK